jgi:NAD(P)-dependent dehydrogenase (short-subunit alcohol dehydrogenase family)
VTAAQREKLQQFADDNHLSMTILPLDVVDDRSVQNSVNTVLSKEGYIDVLINNAGTHTWGAVEELPLELFKADMNTNYFGTLRCIKAVLPSMRKRKAGRIINISTVAAKVFSNFHGAYCASKAALEAVSESLAQELVPYNIQITLVQPAFIETSIFSKINEIPSRTHYPNVKRYLSLFAAALENHESASKVADVIDDILSGRQSDFRILVGLYAEGFLKYRESMRDEDWINSVSVSDEDWIKNMEQMGLKVRKYMQAEGLPQFNHKIKEYGVVS